MVSEYTLCFTYANVAPTPSFRLGQLTRKARFLLSPRKLKSDQSDPCVAPFSATLPTSYPPVHPYHTHTRHLPATTGRHVLVPDAIFCEERFVAS